MNLEYFCSNFNALYVGSNTRRIDISQSTGIAASKITKLRNPKYQTYPTVDDLIAISNYYNVTIDELLTSRKDIRNPYNSLGGIIKTLFEIDDYIKIEFCDIGVETEIPVNSIYFDNEKMTDFINEWKEMKNSISKIANGKELYDLWKKDKIETYSYYTKENGYFISCTDLLKLNAYFDQLKSTITNNNKKE